ncbi:KTSC domain-containing protein [Rivularia sp. UHCC 0363]|uniref:KTSC domain-containing protein n=1 Tax=Rivularia sp. UHCC 0363 TaxID=3110244 RepID=UPI002B212098|nr:KTSC domain-containing protein [Rivularia sp. UHCC 0363]MEA5595215.1 KTSC domain-containing protein [Rivularia sp. UHCC 0363]
MKFSKLDLSNLLGVAHSDGCLQLLLDRGNELEFLEIPAPIQAYEGLQDLNELIAEPPTLLEDETFAMLPVASPMANAIGYDSETEVLQIEFNSGAVYQFSNIDEDTWEDLYTSEAVGRYFNQNIKGRYESQRVDNSC